MSAEDSMQELKEINRLVYLKPDNGALINKRTMKAYAFSSSDYAPGATAQIRVNSGADAVWGSTSYLRMTFTTAATTAVGTGSILNLINSIRITHRSGEILDYIQNYNVLGKLLLKHAVDKQGFEKLRDMLTFPPGGGTFIRCIPMWLLSGIFGEHQTYIPPNMLSGANIDIILESNLIASSTAGGFSNINLQLVLDSSQVYDSVQKSLMDQEADVAQSGLQFSYSTWFNSFGLFPGSAINIDVMQSASVTQMVCAVVRDVGDLVDVADSFIFQPILSTVQFRLGSSYYPQQELRLIPASQDEAYVTSMIAWDAMPKQYAGVTASGGGSSALLSEWPIDQTAFGDACANYSQTLERSSVGLALTGEATNNSRILNFVGTKPVANHRVDMYLKYLRVANVMGSNLVVDR